MLCYCIEKSLKNNCTIVFNTNMKMVFKNCIVENNNEIWSEIAHFSSFLLNFSGFVLTKLNVSAVEIGHRGGIHRVDATSTAIFPNCTPPTGVTRCKSTLFVKKIHRQNPPPNPYFDEYFIFYQAFHVILAVSRVM